MESETRQRKPAHPSRRGEDDQHESSASPSSKPSSSSLTRRVGALDVVRVLGGLLLLSSALSYFVTNESITWGWRPWFSRPDMVRAWIKGPVRLTDDALMEYNGSVEGRPIYLGLNGSIYDVTAGRKTYGPGGGYHFFAGRDAARAFVTGCFQEDLTPDLRGVEEMYVPVDPDTDPSAAPSAEVETGDELKRAGGRSGVKKADLKIQRERDLRQAKKQVKATIEHWQALFSGEKGKPYFKVGEIVREDGWLEKLPRRDLCEAAKSQRPKRKADKKATKQKSN